MVCLTKRTDKPIRLDTCCRVCRKIRLRIGLLGLICLFLTGCATSRKAQVDGHQAFYAGQFDVARKALADASRSRRDGKPSELDLSLVEIASGDTKAAIGRLRTLRDHFATLDPNPPIVDSGALMTDDRARTFRLSAEEQVLLCSLLAMTSQAIGNDDANAYILQSKDRHRNLIESSPAAKTRSVALPDYLRGVTSEATHRDYDLAHRSFARVASFRPDFFPAVEDIQRTTSGVHCAPGHGVLYVYALVGPGPRLESVDATPTENAIAMATSVWADYATRENQNKDDDEKIPLALPDVTTVKVPEVIALDSPVASARVEIDQSILGYTQTITDVTELAVKRIEQQRPATIARAVLRRAAKKIATQATVRAASQDGPTAQALALAINTAWTGTEKADTRCWSLLPRQIQVFRVELPVGTHHLSVAAAGYDGNPLGNAAVQTVEIEEGRNSYRMVMAPYQNAFLIGNDRPFATR